MADEIVSGVSGDELERHLHSIAQWVRLSGTPDEAKAFDYIQSQLEKLGYDVKRYESEALVGYPHHSSLELLGDQTVTIPSNGYSLSPVTSDEGVTGEVVYVGAGQPGDYQGKDVRGKIVISDGLAMPGKALAAQEAGAIGQIHVNDEYIHEMCISPVWGTPIPETAGLLPDVPAVAVTRENGDKIKAAMKQGAVKARIVSQPHYSWDKIPTLTAELPGKHEDTFVLFSGHVDSWHYGAMDNGTANATQLEVARLLAERRNDLHRGVRLAFWSGHSHARYGGSTWYADNFWHDLHERCACHVNIDSVGGKGATVLEEAPTMAETVGFARAVLADTVDRELDYKRISRSSDQSFWIHGIPSVLASLSEQPADDSETAKAMAQLLGGGGGRGAGLGWWWHTTEDTLDKIDRDNLVRDCGVYAEALWRLCTLERLPFDYAMAAEEIATALDRYQEQAGGTFDLSGTRELAETLAQKIRATDLSKADAARANKLVMALGRMLVPVNYTRNGPFEQDLALSTQPVPGLSNVIDLAQADPSSDQYRYIRTELVRQRNRVEHALRGAIRAVEEFQGQQA